MTKAKFFVGDNNDYFCILTDFLDGYKPSEKEIKMKKDRGMTDFFELYDDDDIKYYSGYANLSLMADNDLDEFSILDWAMADSGCTYIKARNGFGAMEMV